MFSKQMDVEKLKFCEIMKNRKESTKEKKEGKIRKGKERKTKKELNNFFSHTFKFMFVLFFLYN